MADYTIKRQDNARVNQQRVSPYAIKNANMGSINTANESVIDKFGLVSLNNFKSDNVLGAIPEEYTTSASIVPLSNTTIQFSLDRTSKVLFVYGGIVGASVTGAGALYLVVDNVSQKNTYYASVNAGANTVSITDFRIENFSEGEHTAYIGFVSFNGVQVSALAVTLAYIVLGN